MGISASTSWPANTHTSFTTPLTGATTGISIFIASNTATWSFSSTRSPTFTEIDTIFPTIGTVTGVAIKTSLLIHRVRARRFNVQGLLLFGHACVPKRTSACRHVTRISPACGRQGHVNDLPESPLICQDFFLRAQ